MTANESKRIAMLLRIYRAAIRATDTGLADATAAKLADCGVDLTTQKVSYYVFSPMANPDDVMPIISLIGGRHRNADSQ